MSFLVIIKLFVTALVLLCSFSICILVAIFLRNKPPYIEYLGKRVKKVFKKVKNNIWKNWCLRLAVLSLYRDNLQSNSMGWFPCNGNTGLKWQRGCMVKVNISLSILFIFSSSKRNVRLQLGDKSILLFKQEWYQLVTNCHQRKR